MTISHGTVELWRQELRDASLLLEKKYSPYESSIENEFEIEKTVFIGFYVIRKLLEAKLVAEKIVSRNYPVTFYPVRSGIVFEDVFKDKWIQAYDIMNGAKSRLTIKKICHQIVHSKIYSPFVVENLGVMGFYFASDTECKNKVNYIQLVKVVEIFSCLAEDRLINLDVDTSVEGRVSIRKT